MMDVQVRAMQLYIQSCGCWDDTSLCTLAFIQASAANGYILGGMLQKPSQGVITLMLRAPGAA